MKDQNKTTQQLKDELGKLRQRIKELEISENKLIQKVERLRESEEKHRDIVELAPDPIFITDLKGKIVTCNSALTKLTGYSKDRFINKHFAKIPTIRKKDILKYTKVFSSLIRGERPKPFGMANFRCFADARFSSRGSMRRSQARL